MESRLETLATVREVAQRNSKEGKAAGADALYRTGQASVARLRELATRYAEILRVAAGQVNTCQPRGHRSGEAARVRAQAKLIGICTAIEVLIVNGNFYLEMNEAVERAESLVQERTAKAPKIEAGDLFAAGQKLAKEMQRRG